MQRTEKSMLIFFGILIISFCSYSFEDVPSLSQNPVLPNQITPLSQSKLNILDYEDAGLGRGSTEYFTIWNMMNLNYSLSLNFSAKVLGEAGEIPSMRFEIYTWANYSNNADPILYSEINNTADEIGVWECEAHIRYIVSIANLDFDKDISYNLSLISDIDVFFEYTEMYDFFGVSEEDKTTVTYFGVSDPVLFGLYSRSPTRVLLSFSELGTSEHYLHIQNRAVTTELFIGVVGNTYEYNNYPEITLYLVDWDHYNKEFSELDVFGFTLLNDTVGFTFLCEEGHDYSLYVKSENSMLPDTFYIILDNFGVVEMDYSENNPPQFAIEIFSSYEDPWVVDQRATRNIIIGIATGSIALVFAGVYIKKNQ